MTETQNGIVCDPRTVSSLFLGITPHPTPIPDAAPGEIVCYYGGWSLQMLRDSSLGKRLMDQDCWYDKYAWSKKKLPSGL